VPEAAAAGLARVGGEHKIKDRLALRDRKTGTLFVPGWSPQGVGGRDYKIKTAAGI
jgi:hypothetical protein